MGVGNDRAGDSLDRVIAGQTGIVACTVEERGGRQTAIVQASRNRDGLPVPERHRDPAALATRGPPMMSEGSGAGMATSKK